MNLKLIGLARAKAGFSKERKNNNNNNNNKNREQIFMSEKYISAY